MARRRVTGGIRLRLGRGIDAHALHELLETCLLTVCTTAFSGFDGVEELAAFASAVLDE